MDPPTPAQQTLRPFQRDLFAIASDRNIIVHAPTGSVRPRKTSIAQVCAGKDQDRRAAHLAHPCSARVVAQARRLPRPNGRARRSAGRLCPSGDVGARARVERRVVERFVGCGALAGLAHRHRRTRLHASGAPTFAFDHADVGSSSSIC